MKKIDLLLTAILLLGFCNLYSQKCKVEPDPFTKENVVSFNFMSKIIYFEMKGGVVHMEIKATYNGSLKVIVPQGSEVMLKLDNDQIIKLTTSADAVPITRATATQYSASMNTDYSYVMEVSKEDIKKLAESKANLIRYPDTKGGSTDIKLSGFNGKLANEIKKGAECISSHF